MWFTGIIALWKTQSKSFLTTFILRLPSHLEKHFSNNFSQLLTETMKNENPTKQGYTNPTTMAPPKKKCFKLPRVGRGKKTRIKKLTTKSSSHNLGENQQPNSFRTSYEILQNSNICFWMVSLEAFSLSPSLSLSRRILGYLQRFRTNILTKWKPNNRSA